MEDRNKAGSELRNDNIQTNDTENTKLANEKSIDNKTCCSTKAPNIQERIINKGNAKINVNGQEKFEKLPKSYLNCTQNIISNVKQGAKEDISKFKNKHFKTSTLIVNADNNCLQLPKQPWRDKQEVNTNINNGTSTTEDSEIKGRCPIYFGIKSYLHQFYAPPDKTVLKSGDYIQEDDFEFLVEPGKRRWRRCWFRVGKWVGINLLLLGSIILIVAYLMHSRQPVVRQNENIEILDKWAIAFNYRLDVCRFIGLCVFCVGAVIVMLTLLISSDKQETTRTYFVMRTTILPNTFIGNPLIGQQQRWYNTSNGTIPIASIVQPVQPNSILTSSIHR